MSVRKQRRRNSDGLLKDFWIVDVKFRHKDGTVERIRKVPRRQTRAAAEKLERSILSDLEGPRGGDQTGQEAVSSPTLATFVQEFLTNYVEANNKPSEAHTKRVIFALHLLPELGTKKVDMISARDIDSYKAKKLASGLAAKTVNNHLAVLRKALRVAFEWNLSTKVVSIRPLKVKLPDVRFLSFDQAAELVAATEPRWRAMVVVALNTGLRQGELLALGWSHVDLENGRLVVRDNDWKGIVGSPKSGRMREVPLNEMALAALAEHPRIGKLVFCRQDGTRLTYQQCRRPLMRACVKGAVPLVQWHGLRHTFASHLVMRGVQLKAVQELLGHSTQAMTERYAHLTPDVRRDAVSVLNPNFSRGNLGAT